MINCPKSKQNDSVIAIAEDIISGYAIFTAYAETEHIKDDKETRDTLIDIIFDMETDRIIKSN